MTVRRRALPMLLALSLASACGFLSSKPNRYFSLDRIPPAQPPAPALAAVRGLPIGIDVIELPPGFDRTDIVVRNAEHRLDVRGKEQWSAPLEPMVLHTLAFDLAARLPEGMVILPGQAKPAGDMRAIDVVFEELAAGPEKAFVLDARWTLRGPRSAVPDVTHHERITVDTALDSASIAAATSRALATLADRIAAAL